MSNPRSSVLTIRFAGALVALVGVAATGALAQAPPPSGFDTSVCHGRGVDPPENGRLIGHIRRTTGLYSIRPNGSGLRRETKPPRGFNDFYPAPSRDGGSIAFLRMFRANADARPKRLMVVNMRTHKTRFLTSDFFQLFAPAWSPDGKWITSGTVQTKLPGGSFRRDATLIRRDGTGRRVLSVDGYQLLSGSWSPNGRCFAAVARFRHGDGSGFNPEDAGVAVVGSGGGRATNFYPRPPACPSGSGCVSTLPSYGPNEPNYVQWTADGRRILALRGTYLRAPKHSYDRPDRIDVMRSGLSSSRTGKVLVRNADIPHMAPNGRFLTAWSIRRRAWGVFRMDGRLVHLLPRFYVGAWGPTRR